MGSNPINAQYVSDVNQTQKVIFMKTCRSNSSVSTHSENDQKLFAWWLSEEFSKQRSSVLQNLRRRKQRCLDIGFAILYLLIYLERYGPIFYNSWGSPKVQPVARWQVKCCLQWNKAAHVSINYRLSIGIYQPWSQMIASCAWHWPKILLSTKTCLYLARRQHLTICSWMM